jgi:hypothetical protein
MEQGLEGDIRIIDQVQRVSSTCSRNCCVNDVFVQYPLTFLSLLYVFSDARNAEAHNTPKGHATIAQQDVLYDSLCPADICMCRPPQTHNIPPSCDISYLQDMPEPESGEEVS